MERVHGRRTPRTPRYLKGILGAGLQQVAGSGAGMSSNLFYETRWRQRTPFADEAAMGAQAAETRLIVRARARSRESNVYTVSFMAENRLRMKDGTWAAPELTDEFHAYVRPIADDLNRELIQGIRVR